MTVATPTAVRRCLMPHEVAPLKKRVDSTTPVRKLRKRLDLTEGEAAHIKHEEWRAVGCPIWISR